MVLAEKMTRDPLSKATYLSVINLAGAEQSIKRVVTRNNEPSKVDEELSGNVEED